MLLVDFAAYCPEQPTRATGEDNIATASRLKGLGVSDPDCLKILAAFNKTTGVASTCVPSNLFLSIDDDPSAFSTSFEAAAAESRACMVAVVEQVLAKTGVAASDIDILVTTGSTFHPVPSLASMLVNHFKMKPEIKSYHLGCMACSAGAIGINLVQDLLKANPNSNALFVPHENITLGCYTGRDVNKALANTLFGMGAAALLLTNKPSLARQAKYKLLHSVRVHVGQDDRIYRSMGIFESDEAGERVKYTQDVPMAAAKAIRAAVTKAAPNVLSWTQLAAAAKTALMRLVWGDDAAPRYVPAFADSTIDHFLLHPGSHGMLKGFMNGLGLTVDNTLASAAALRDYGNTSSSSTYYVLAYLESLVGVKKGQKLMQVSVGTGVKAGVNVWRALRDVKDTHLAWEHLQGIPVTEMDLPLALQVATGEDSHAAVAEMLQAMGSKLHAADVAPTGSCVANSPTFIAASS